MVTTKKNQPQQTTKYRKLNTVAYHLGIAALCLFWFPLLNIGLAIPSFIMANQGKKDTYNPERHRKAYGISLTALILGILVLLTIIVIIPVLAATGKI